MGYVDDVQNALDYIEENIETKVTLKQLAQYTLCSEFHFHRIFHAAVGLPLNEYLRKRRLSKAAELLKNTNNKINDISLKCGYGSQIAFTKAFKSMFGLTPGQFCRNKLPVTLYEKVNLNGRKFLNSYHGITLGPMITYIQQIRMVGLEVSGTFLQFEKDELTPNLWRKFLPLISKIENAIGESAYGVLYSNQGTDIYTYHIGIEIGSSGRIPEEMVERVVPASMYALFIHKYYWNNPQDTETIPDTHNYMYNTWMANSEYVHSGNIYLIERLTRVSMGMDMLIPISPKV